MFKDLETLIFIGVVAMGTALYKFTSWLQFMKDGILGFIIGMVSVMILSYFDLPKYVEGGLGGAFVLWSKPFYEMVWNFILNKLPEIISKRISNDKQ